MFMPFSYVVNQQSQNPLFEKHRDSVDHFLSQLFLIDKSLASKFQGNSNFQEVHFPKFLMEVGLPLCADQYTFGILHPTHMVSHVEIQSEVNPYNTLLRKIVELGCDKKQLRAIDAQLANDMNQYLMANLFSVDSNRALHPSQFDSCTNYFANTSGASAAQPGNLIFFFAMHS
jgi:hypothetical protein